MEYSVEIGCKCKKYEKDQKQLPAKGRPGQIIEFFLMKPQKLCQKKKVPMGLVETQALKLEYNYRAVEKMDHGSRDARHFMFAR